MAARGSPVPLQAMRKGRTLPSEASSANSTPASLRRSPPRNRPASTLPMTPSPVAERSVTVFNSREPLATSPTNSSNGSGGPLRRPADSAQETKRKRWLPSHQTLKIVGALMASVTLLIAIINLSPAFRSQNIDKESLDMARYSAWLQYLGNCLTKASQGNVSENCQKAIDSSSQDIPPPNTASYIVTRTIFGIFGHEGAGLHTTHTATILSMGLLVLSLAALCLLFRQTLGNFLTFLSILHNKATPEPQEQDDGVQPSEIRDDDDVVMEKNDPTDTDDDFRDLFTVIRYLYKEEPEEGIQYDVGKILRHLENIVKNYVTEEENGFRCRVHYCYKLFRSYEFWLKHIKKRHAEFDFGTEREVLIEQYPIVKMRYALKQSNQPEAESPAHPTYLAYQRPVNDSALSISGHSQCLAEYSNRKRRSPSNTPPPTPPSTEPGGLQRTWFIPADGILREVITVDISRYLGPNAVVRPGIGKGDYEGVEGYYYTAYRSLTSAMVQDLRSDSASWARIAASNKPTYTQRSSSFAQPTRMADTHPADSTPTSIDINSGISAYNSGRDTYNAALPATGYSGSAPSAARDTSSASNPVPLSTIHNMQSQGTYATSNAYPYGYSGDVHPRSSYVSSWDISENSNSRRYYGPTRYVPPKQKEPRTGYYLASDGHEYPISLMPKDIRVGHSSKSNHA